MVEFYQEVLTFIIFLGWQTKTTTALALKTPGQL
jgi:hypothetical protein